MGTKIIKRLLPLFIIIASFILYTSIYSILKYKYLYTGIYDLGNMNQTLWNTLHGYFFMETDPNGTAVLVSRLSDHADFLLLFLTPIYALFSSPITLIVIQSVIVGLGAIPVYLFAREKTDSKLLPLMFALIFLFMPPVVDPVLFDFHPVTLSITFLLFSFYFLYKRKFYLALPFIFLTLISKEEAGITLSMLGIYFLAFLPFIAINPTNTFGANLFIKIKKYYFNKIRKLKRSEIIFLIMLIVIPFTYSLVVIFKIIPNFRHDSSLYLKNYGGNSTGVFGMIGYYIHNYKDVISQRGYKAFQYSVALVSPFGGLSLLSPFILLISVFEWFIDCLSSNNLMQSIFFQYEALIDPFVVISAISGFFLLDNVLTKKFSKSYKTSYLAIFILSISLIFGIFSGQLPFERYYVPISVMQNSLSGNDIREIDYLSSSLGDNISITAENNVGSHFTSRPFIYMFPVNSNYSDYVITTHPNIFNDPENYFLIYNEPGLYVYKKKQ